VFRFCPSDQLKNFLEGLELGRRTFGPQEDFFHQKAWGKHRGNASPLFELALRDAGIAAQNLVRCLLSHRSAQLPNWSRASQGLTYLSPRRSRIFGGLPKTRRTSRHRLAGLVDRRRHPGPIGNTYGYLSEHPLLWRDRKYAAGDYAEELARRNAGPPPYETWEFDSDRSVG